MKISFIGDNHGKMEVLLPLLKRRCQDSDFTLQLGDMGLGFPGVHLPIVNRSFQFIRGNHDNPKLCIEHPNYAGEFGMVGPVFFVGGAFSIDWRWRIPGYSWWPDEELNLEQGQQAYEAYVKAKPRIVASHDCPQEIGEQLLRDGGFRPEKWGSTESRTAKLLQDMWDAHKPDYWFFGHYHRDWRITARGTRFHCLNELSLFHLNTETMMPKEESCSPFS